MTEQSPPMVAEQPHAGPASPVARGLAPAALAKAPVLVPLLIIVLIAGGAALYARVGESGASGSGAASGRLVSLVGHPAPSFSLRDLGGQQVTLREAAGSPLIINAWATWCVPCRQEMPAIQRAYEANRASGLKVFAIDADEDASAVRSFQSRLNLTLPILIDDGSFERAYGIIGLPSSIFVDRHGIVRSVQLGQMSEQALREKLDTIIGPGAPA